LSPLYVRYGAFHDGEVVIAAARQSGRELHLVADVNLSFTEFPVFIDPRQASH
jgi:hypothetical protein